MTLDELKQMQHGIPPYFPCCVINPNFQHHYVQPIPADDMAHTKTEKPDNVYNGISLEQAAALGRYKNMDSLHKADAISAEFTKSKRLKAELKEIGESAFISRRLKS